MNRGNKWEFRFWSYGLKGYTFCPLRGPPHNIAHDLLYAGFTALISRTTADLTWRSYVGANHTELPRLVPKFPLFRLTLIRVLWVKPTRSWKVISSFCPSVKLSHMDMLKSDASFNWTCSIIPTILFLQKRQRCKTWTLFWRNNVYKKWIYLNQ